PFLPTRYLLSYLEAILRVYNQLGRRDNLYKARIKILVDAVGAASFARMVEDEWDGIRDGYLDLPAAEIERIQAFFAPPAYEASSDTDVTAASEPAFRAWYRYNTRPHKVAGYRAVFVSLKAHGVAPGDATSEQMEALADLADRESFGLIRATHDQNLLLADVRQSQLHAVWQELREHGLAMPNIGTLTDMIACPGLDFCSLANAGTISVAKQIQARFDDLDYLYDLGEIAIKMSGCMNACGHHHVGHIGILGVDKHGEEWYQITLGGSVSGRTALGEVIGPSVAQADVAATIERIVEVYRAERLEDEPFIETYRRIGAAPFRASVYGKESQRALQPAAA
ncbi:MAG TPA: nitrite/sulfite reductase, partial [Steroidobacteraceae bacterium]|nr:nitrite/sulfite reductase [Steroidobacteraceae bacterium]